jgi:ubiquitin-protein ligase
MWWLADKMRLARELRGLAELAEEGWLSLGTWSLEGLDLQVIVTIKAPGAEYSLRLVLPSFFPNVPAWLAPTDGNLRLSNHQFGAGGSLCLELGPDNWTPAMTGADVVRSAYKLLSTENPKGEGARGEVEEGLQIAPFQIGYEKFSVLVEQAVMDRLNRNAWPLRVRSDDLAPQSRQHTGFRRCTRWHQ